jgi:putative zinc finger protein
MFRTLTHMVSCKEATRLLSQQQDRTLSYAERVKLRLHLAVCAACTRFSRQLAFMREAFSRYRS